MEALIESGRRHYDMRQHKSALKDFTRAMNFCPCNRGTKRKRCSCKEYDAVARRNGSLLSEAMFTCHCDVGRDFPPCDDALHITALDCRAATFEAMQEISRAEKDAMWMLELAPRLPDGYLRLGKVARLRKDPWFAWKVYSAGVVACKHICLTSSLKLRQLHIALLPLKKRFMRRDPMSLPFEMVHEIFRYLDVVELTACLRVSKTWKQTLEADDSHDLWRLLDFAAPPQAPSKIALQAIVDRSGRDVRRIVIRNPRKFQLTQPKLAALLRHSQNLEHLELGQTHERFYRFPEGPGQYQKLRHLVMGQSLCWDATSWVSQTFPSPGAGFLPTAFLANVAGTLEYLDLSAIPLGWREPRNLPEFPNLKALRLAHKDGTERQAPLPILSLAPKTPRLRQLRLDHVVLDKSRSWEWARMWPTLWTELKVFVFIMPLTVDTGRLAVETLECVALINSLHLGRTFEHLDFEIPVDRSPGPWNHDDYSPLKIFSDEEEPSPWFHAQPDVPRLNQFDNLRSLRISCFPNVALRMYKITAGAVASGKLHTFDIVFPLESSDFPPGLETKSYLDGYWWLRGLDSIRCLGLSGFSIPDILTPYHAPTLSDFLASFPNLDTLSLSPRIYREGTFCALVEDIMQRTKVKIIYQDGVRGHLFDCLGRLGRQNGVVVEYGQRPRAWPIMPEV